MKRQDMRGRVEACLSINVALRHTMLWCMTWWESKMVTVFIYEWTWFKRCFQAFSKITFQKPSMKEQQQSPAGAILGSPYKLLKRKNNRIKQQKHAKTVTHVDYLQRLRRLQVGRGGEIDVTWQWGSRLLGSGFLLDESLFNTHIVRWVLLGDGFLKVVALFKFSLLQGGRNMWLSSS